MTTKQLARRPAMPDYVRGKERPLNIAHRGFCSLFPENTLASISAAMFAGADLVQFDLILTKENVLLAMHDPFLSKITDIKARQQFSTRKRSRMFAGAIQEDWWADDFTLAELQTLRIKQTQAPGRITTVDNLLTFTTLQDIIEYGLSFNLLHQGRRNIDHRPAGLIIQAKSSQLYREEYGIEISQLIVKVLAKYGLDTIAGCQKRLPIYLCSFDLPSVRIWSANCELPISFLFSQLDNQLTLQEIATLAVSVGVTESTVWDCNNHIANGFVEKVKDCGLLIHVWTFKEDLIYFNAKNYIQALKIGTLKLKLDGLITEFPETLAIMQALI